MAIGSMSAIPTAIVAKPGAINRNEAIATHHLSQLFKWVSKYPEKAIPSDAIPSIAPKSVIVNSHQVKPSATKSKAGE